MKTMRGLVSKPKDTTAPDAGNTRRSPRLKERELIVEYWDGVAPIGSGLRDISDGGAYICTAERWYSGAIIRLIFRGQKPTDTPMSVLAQVVRQGDDGIAMEFMFSSKRERESFHKFLASIPAGKAKAELAAKAAPVASAAPVNDTKI